MEQWEHLLQELRQEFLLREDELQLLHEIDVQLLKSDRPFAAIFDLIIRRTQELLGSDSTFILLRRGRRLEAAYSADRSLVGQHVPIGQSLTGLALSAAATVNVSDVAMEPYASKYVPIHHYAGPQLRSLLAAPIKVRQTMVGVLSVESSRANAFKPVHERIITAVASQVAIALQRVQLFDQNKLFSEVEELIFAAGESHLAIPAALQKVMNVLQDLEHVEVSGAQIMFLRGSDELEVAHSTGTAEAGMVVSIEHSVPGQAFREQKTITIGDTSSEPQYHRLHGSVTQSAIAIPILLRNTNVAIGVLNVESEEPDAFEGFCQVLLENFADKVRTLLAFAKLRSDVTETMEMRTANDLLVAVGDQASNMIHRINNVVGVMRLRIIEMNELVQSGEIDEAFLTESFAALIRLVEQTLKMPEEVSQLLSQQGSTVNVNDVVRMQLEKFRVPDDVKLDLEFSADIPILSLYSFDIVVQNLIQNALDAMPNGGHLTISTRSVLDADAGYVELSVEDTGMGISADVLPRIFELNFSTKHSRGRAHGLGLWWIRNFVLRSRGDITVTSTPNGGSEFIVKIPVDHRARDAAVLPAAG